MNLRGILQGLCGPGHHDRAEVHDSPGDLHYIPLAFKVHSFLEAAPPHQGNTTDDLYPILRLTLRPHPGYNEASTTTPPSNTSSSSQQQTALVTLYELPGIIYTPDWDDYQNALFTEVTFGMWDFSAVSVSQPPGRGRYEMASAIEVMESRCRFMRERSWPTRDNGPGAIPPLPQGIPCAPAHPYTGESSGSTTDQRHCSVLIYLGSTRGMGAKHFSYRNDKMYLNQMIEMQLDVEPLARRVAVTLALLHWAVEIDACGVKFYLVTSWASPGATQNVNWPAFARTKLEVDNLEQAHHMEMDDVGLELAVSAASASQHIPKPNQRLPIQQRMWDAFVCSYIGASDIILRELEDCRALQWPRMFIRGLIEREQQV
ncbi:hypothetical protein TrVFT333_002208 [Trichoderma virens FT-333]|nr:hypothetical protein TrVFT333_002208 [Trichoderma virens FT-333]